MGVQDIFGISPVAMVRDLVPGLGTTMASSDERLRRIEACDRRLLYQDKPESVIKRLVVGRVFDDPTVRARMSSFVPFTTSQALYKRTVNEVARTAYMVPPTRRIEPAGAQEKTFAALADEVNINCVMDSAARLAVACNSSFLVARFANRLQRIVIDVVSPDMVTVIPDPEDPLCAVAYIYDKQVWDPAQKRWATWRVYWDDTVTFQIDANGSVRPFPGMTEAIVKHGYRRIPIVAIHSVERFSEYWNYSTGRDLMYAHLSDVLLQLLSLRKLKAQGFRKLVVQGDLQGFPKGQIFDEEAAILAPTGTSVADLASEADASNYMSLQTDIRQNASANRGISRKRLNAEGVDSSDDTGLMEQRSEVIKFMAPAEYELFDVLQMLSSKHHPNFQIAEGTLMTIDYGEIPHRMDRKTVLEIREMEKKAGTRNVLDDIMEDNPECRTEADAEAELQRNLEVQSKFIEQIRALNQSTTADASQPGQTPAQNGAMGPKVRDALITKDAAAAQAAGTDTTSADYAPPQ